MSLLFPIRELLARVTFSLFEILRNVEAIGDFAFRDLDLPRFLCASTDATRLWLQMDSRYRRPTTPPHSTLADVSAPLRPKHLAITLIRRFCLVLCFAVIFNGQD